MTSPVLLSMPLGTNVEMRGFQGDFTIFANPKALPLPSFLPTIPPKLLFIAGGICITPFLSMIRGIREISHLQHRETFDIVLIWSVKRNEDVLIDLLQEMAPFVSTTIITVTSSSNQNEQGRDHRQLHHVLGELESENTILHHRRVDVAMVQEYVEQRTAYVCGPDPFMQTISVMLQHLGIAETNIKTETFNF